jgi:hypothetical protein
VQRWDSRHPDSTWTFGSDAVAVESPDGAHATFGVPLGRLERCDLSGLLAHLDQRWRLGVVLVRRGGFAVAYVDGPDVVDVKIGQRHVQGRSKAGGWSQQRFARRRANQAREAFDAASEHAGRLLAGRAGTLDLLVLGGDRAGVQAVLDHPRLERLSGTPQQWVPVAGDPRRPALDTAVDVARSVQITVVDPQRE